nr:reverse transcriptase domain-containing protein [Tanacetum cinerariifolium]
MSRNEDHHRQGRRFAARGNGHDGPDPRDVEIERLRQRVRELKVNGLIHMARRVSDYRIRRIADRGNEEDGPDSRARGDRFYHNRRSADRGNEKIQKRIRELELQRELTKETESKPIIWDIRDEEEEYPFVNKYPSLQEPSMLVEEESCPVYDTDNEKESEVIYDTYGNDVDDSPKFELLHTGQGDSLVIQRVLSVAPSKSINDDSWRRNNIFRTKYNSNDGYLQGDQDSRSNHYNEGKIDAGGTNVDAMSTRDNFVSCSFGWPENNTDDRYLVGHGRLPLGLRLAGSKDRPVQWKSRIKRYIDTKPNHEFIHYCLENPLYELGWKDKVVPTSEGSLITTTERVHETYKSVLQEIRDQLNAEAEAVQIILTGIDNDIYSTVDACPNACEMWKAIKRVKQGESINVQDLETNLYWEFRKFTSQDGETLESYYSTFYKMMNKLIRNQCKNQELKTVSYHKLYDILKQHQHEVNEIRAERIARVANPLALVSQQQPVYHP